MTPTARGCAAAVLCLTAAAATACAAEVKLAADEAHLWRVVYNETDDASTVYVRSDGRWVGPARSRGYPASVFAATGRLYVFFASGGYAYYSPRPRGVDGPTVGPLWPAPWRGRSVLAACPGAAGDTPHTRPLYV
ncbi:MAG: hypothetical protein ACOC7R_03245, partial [Planctomycetota bacterium]